MADTPDTSVLSSSSDSDSKPRGKETKKDKEKEKEVKKEEEEQKEQEKHRKEEEDKKRKKDEKKGSKKEIKTPKPGSDESPAINDEAVEGEAASSVEAKKKAAKKKKEEEEKAKKKKKEKEPEEVRRLRKRFFKKKKRNAERWKEYYKSMADSIVGVSTFLGGSAFVGVTLALNTNDTDTFKTIVIAEVAAFSCFILAILFANVMKLDCTVTHYKKSSIYHALGFEEQQQQQLQQQQQHKHRYSSSYAAYIPERIRLSFERTREEHSAPARMPVDNLRRTPKGSPFVIPEIQHEPASPKIRRASIGTSSPHDLPDVSDESPQEVPRFLGSSLGGLTHRPHRQQQPQLPQQPPVLPTPPSAEELSAQHDKIVELERRESYLFPRHLSLAGGFTFLLALFHTLLGMVLLLGTTILIALVQTDDSPPHGAPGIVVIILVTSAGCLSFGSMLVATCVFARFAVSDKRELKRYKQILEAKEKEQRNFLAGPSLEKIKSLLTFGQLGSNSSDSDEEIELGR